MFFVCVCFVACFVCVVVFVVRRLLLVVGCSCVVLRCGEFVGCCLLDGFVVCLLFVVGLFVGCWLTLFGVCFLLLIRRCVWFVVRCVLFVVCWSLFVVRCAFSVFRCVLFLVCSVLCVYCRSVVCCL